jgi:hypothetical protein
MIRIIQNIIFFSPVLLLVATSCNENLEYNVQDPDDMIVIDGWIENDQYAKVLLTRNTPYFSSLDSASLRELVLSRAKVTLTDGERSEILTLRRNNDYFPPFVFTGSEIRGEVGKTYTLTAEYGGRLASGSTTIPAPVILDTIYYVNKQNTDSGTIYLEFRDPPFEKNYYRILTKILGMDPNYYSSMIMAISDEFFSGQEFGFTIYRGQRSYISAGTNEYFKIGDTVSIKFCTIDEAHYDFWSSFQDEILNTGNPFASSLSVIKSNIKGDGLGIWGGYGVSHYMMIIK